MKITIIGDAAVGKTALIETYISSVFPEDHHPTTFDTHEAVIVVQDKPVKLQLWEVGSLVTEPLLRSQAFYGSNLFVILYSIVDPPTFEAVQNWLVDLDEFRTHEALEELSVVIVGNKEDLRGDAETQKQLQTLGTGFVTKAMVQEKEFPVCGHFLVSAKTGDGVKEFFDKAIELAAESLPQSQGRCGAQ